MTNFNHERIGIVIQCLRFSRVCLSESLKYAHKRRTFGKRLIDHPVIRLKLAHMARQIEASYSWLESLIYQCQMMSDTEAMLKLGGAIAGLKAQSTTTFEFCAREASQIFGGLSYSRGGQGGKIERYGSFPSCGLLNTWKLMYHELDFTEMFARTPYLVARKRSCWT